MKLREKQAFLSLYYEPNAVEVATGEADSFASVESWHRETKQLGQVATPERIAVLMAKWVMSARPRTVLDPAAGLGGLLAACRQLDRAVSRLIQSPNEETRAVRLSVHRACLSPIPPDMKQKRGRFLALAGAMRWRGGGARRSRRCTARTVRSGECKPDTPVGSDAEAA